MISQACREKFRFDDNTVKVLEAAGADDAFVEIDFNLLLVGRLTAKSLWDCCNDADDSSTETGWRNYVSALVAAL